MTSNPFLSGIVPVLQTPFDDDGRIDLDSVGRLIADALEAGASGFLVPAVASEVSCLSEDERGMLLQEAVRVVAGRVPVIAGASAVEADLSQRLCRQAADRGASACLIAVPANCYAKPDALVPFFRQAADGCALPLIVQDLEFNGPGLNLNQMRALADVLPTLAGWKIETVPAGPKYTAAREVFGDRYCIMGGWAIAQMIEALDRCVDALIPESSMVRVYDAIYRAHTAGHRDEAIRLFRQMLPIVAYSNQEIVTSIAFFKRLLCRKGIFRTETLRWSGFQWDRFNSRIADELISHYLALEATLENV